MTRSIIRSGESLNNLGSLSQDWFRQVEQSEGWSLHRKVKAIDDALQIAERFCATVSCPLTVLVERASGRISSTEKFLNIPQALTKSIDMKCRDIGVDSTRYTAKSRAKWGVELVRFIATLARSGDLGLLSAAAERSKALRHKAPRPKTAGEVETVEVTESPAPIVEANVDPMIAIEAKLASEELRDPPTIFRLALTGIGADCVPSCSDTNLPNNFGMNLFALQRLTRELTIKYAIRRSLTHTFEPATPQFVKVDFESLHAYRAHITSVGADLYRHHGSTNCELLSESVVDHRHFPPAQWEKTQDIADGPDEVRYRKAVSAMKRKRVVIDDPSYKPHFTYGTPRKIEEHVASGKSAIITGLSGTGKSTLLNKLPLSDATVFQLGGDIDAPRQKHFIFPSSQADRMIKKAARTRGRKVLIAHEFFIAPRLVEQLGIFDQLVLVGDPMQPGACGDASHLFRLIKDIGGRAFTLSVVWRASNPLSMMAVNYIAYGSRFTICTRDFKGKGDFQFELIVCDDSTMVIAASMLSYALHKISLGRSVMIGAGEEKLVQALKILLSLTPQCPENLHCRHLDDLQGREADVLVVDVHDVATSIPAPADALRFFFMLLGRARHTTCFALGRRNMTVDPEYALPIEVYAGVVLRHRLRSTETKTLQRQGFQFETLSKTYSLVFLDEETIALMRVVSGVTDIVLIKDRTSHNAAMVKDTYLTIEAPEFFSDTKDVDHHCFILCHFCMDYVSPPRGKVYSFSEIEVHTRKSRR